MPRPPDQQNTISSCWGIRLSQWLWSKRGFIWSTLGVIIIGIGVNWLTAPTILADTPLGTGLLWARENPLLAGCFILILFLLSLLVGVVSRLAEPPQVGLTSGPQQLPPIDDSNTVLFDEAHGQSLWTWSGMPPTIDEGYRRIKELTKQYHTVEVLKDKKDLATKLNKCATFVLATGPGIKADECKEGYCHLENWELKAIHDYVRQGGGLLVLGYYTGDWHHGANLNDLLKDYGIEFEKDVVMPEGATPDHARYQVDAGPSDSKYVVVVEEKAANPPIGGELLQGVDRVATLSSCSLRIYEAATPLLRSGSKSTLFTPKSRGLSCLIQEYEEDKSKGSVVLIGAAKNHKVIAVGSWKMFLNGFIDNSSYHNCQLYENVLKWLTAKRRGG